MCFQPVTGSNPEGKTKMAGGRRTGALLGAANAPFSSVPSGGLKCPVCSFVYGTKWEFNRHLKNKHGLKLVENEGDPKWEVTFESTVLILTFPDARDRMEQAWVLPEDGVFWSGS